MTDEHPGGRVAPHPKKAVQLGAKRIAYVELGSGFKDAGTPAILFLHGNPTSSYLWRNVMPAVAAVGRCVAPDLIGMGDSDKLADPGPGTYRFATHSAFLDRFIDTVIGTERPVCWSGTIGDRRWPLTGPTGTADGSPGSPIWRRLCGR